SGRQAGSRSAGLAPAPALPPERRRSRHGSRRQAQALGAGASTWGAAEERSYLASLLMRRFADVIRAERAVDHLLHPVNVRAAPVDLPADQATPELLVMPARVGLKLLEHGLLRHRRGLAV